MSPDSRFLSPDSTPCFHDWRAIHGWNGSLVLFDAALSSTTPCRF